MKARNSAMKLIALVAIVMTGALWGATGASALREVGLAAHVGMVGITAGQTARLNVFRDDPFFSDNPFFRVELSFVDGDGNILAQKVIDLDSGKSAFLDLKGSEVPPRDTNRTQIRGVVRFVGTPDTRTYMWTPTLEVIDSASGETRFLVPAVQKVQTVNQ
jgi:hypothetical protein